MHRFLTAAAGVLWDAVQGEPCTMGPLVAASKTMVLAGTAMALSGLTVTASMFIVRKWLWRYLGVHAAERLRHFGPRFALLPHLDFDQYCLPVLV